MKELKIVNLWTGAPGEKQLHRTDLCYTPNNGVSHLAVLQWLMAQTEVKVYRLYLN